MRRFDVVILAAGKGERMISDKPKVMHEIMGKPMIDYVVGAAMQLNPAVITVVTGHGREKVEEHLKDVNVCCATQTAQNGTAHALLSAAAHLTGNGILVLYGDVPLITFETLKAFLSFYDQERTILFMTTDVENPTGYGRVISDRESIIEIKEEIEASPAEREIKEINTGICVIPSEKFEYLEEIKANNKKGEYYLTDICAVARSKGDNVRKFKHEKATEVLGVNSRKELMDANIVMRARVLERHLKNGVSFMDDNVYIDGEAQIGKDTTIYPNCYIEGKTIIGDRVTIGPNSIIRNSRIHDGVFVKGFTTIDGVEIMSGVEIGPFSRLRPDTKIDKNACVGNFVEIKNSSVGERSNINHLAYIGDAVIGNDVNIGAGAVTCNFDGVTKHSTTIEDGAFIGSNVGLVAPVSVGSCAVVGAGSTITKNVPKGTLAVSRSRQKHVEDYRRK